LGAQAPRHPAIAPGRVSFYFEIGYATCVARHGDREKFVEQHADAAVEQVMLAASNSPAQVRGVLLYWFGLVYDAGSSVRGDEATIQTSTEESGGSMKEVTAKLKKMSERLEAKLDQDAGPGESGSK